jgi:hypothetical protein
MMNKNRRGVGGLILAISVGVCFTPLAAHAQSGETTGIITEIKVGRGRVEVKPTGSQDWKQAGPLLALRTGDQVRATEDATAVILFSGERGSVRVDPATSPFIVPPIKREESKTQKTRALLDASLNFLSSTAKEPPRAALSTRGGPKPPVILTPRNGFVLPNSLTFEWQGSRFSRYTIRVLGPAGVVLERKDLNGTRFDYPPDAPPLTSGVRYTFQVNASGHPPQEVWFELVNFLKAQAVQHDLGWLEQALGPRISPNSLVALRVGLLLREGLIHDARLLLAFALTGDPDEPTLHLLLGNLYLKTGLSDMAAESYDEAKFLLTAKPIPRR